MLICAELPISNVEKQPEVSILAEACPKIGQK